MTAARGALYANKTQSTLIQSGKGVVYGIVANSHSSGTIALTDGVQSGAVEASGTLTSSGAMAAASHAVTEITSSGASAEATHVVSTLTADAVVAGNVVVIGAITYTAVAGLVDGGSAYQVNIGTSTAKFLDNLKLAINGTGQIGVNYGDGTVAHTQVVATTNTATTQIVRGRVPGTSLNTVASTGTALRTVWEDTTLGGGTGDSVAGITTAAALIVINTRTYTLVDALSETYGADAIVDQILKGSSEATMLDNLKKAVNASGTEGTHYSTGTVVNADVVAIDNSDTVQDFIAKDVGAVPNTYPTTTTVANLAWADTTLGGGTANSNPGVTTAAATMVIGTRTYTFVVELSETSGADAVADQILHGSAAANALDNMKLAINASGTPGTLYSTGTTINTDVEATTNTDTTQLVVARVAGTAGNAIVTTDTLANFAWGAGTLASGAVETEARVMLNTYTFPSGSGQLDLPTPVAFNNGLFTTVGGTLDYTVLYRAE